MRKIKKGFLAFLASIVLLSSLPASSLPYSAAITAEAHSGRTDARGGHRDNKNKSGLGSYHYHCGGHPAHLHPNGVCPYSGQTTSSGSTSAAQLPQQNQTAANTDQALLDKYQSVLADFDTKQNGYFTLEINQLIYNFIAAGGVSDAFLAGFLTPKKPRICIRPSQPHSRKSLPKSSICGCMKPLPPRYRHRRHNPLPSRQFPAYRLLLRTVRRPGLPPIPRQVPDRMICCTVWCSRPRQDLRSWASTPVKSTAFLTRKPSRL